MSKFERFMKQNKKVKENTTFTPTTSLTDENGEPLKWIIRPISTRENEALIDSCNIELPGENGSYITKFDAIEYRAKMVSSCVVYPELNDEELLGSYDVYAPEDLVREMLDPAEYAKFADFISEYNGFGNPQKKLDEAKN